MVLYRQGHVTKKLSTLWPWGWPVPEGCGSHEPHTEKLTGGASRVKQGLSSSPQYPQVLKKNEQMYALLAVVLSLCPAAQGSLEESVTSQLREK